MYIRFGIRRTSHITYDVRQRRTTCTMSMYDLPHTSDTTYDMYDVGTVYDVRRNPSGRYLLLINIISYRSTVTFCFSSAVTQHPSAEAVLAVRKQRSFAHAPRRISGRRRIRIYASRVAWRSWSGDRSIINKGRQDENVFPCLWRRFIRFVGGPDRKGKEVCTGSAPTPTPPSPPGE